ncbi:MAG: REP-associated tyrosine transposase [Planctomycetota bacterium]|jgi:REP element-mobilizing transposase RayT
MDKERNSPIHVSPIDFFNKNTIVFLTVCTDKRKQILANEIVYKQLLDAWQKADAWSIGRYVIMPDHIHFFCSPAKEGVSLAKWVTFWKSHVSRKWPFPEQQPVWQRDFWDRQLRSYEKYEEKWEYVCQNPVRKGLVNDLSEWRFQGELNSLTIR